MTANSNSFIFDYHDGVYGWNESSARGADTFHPFSGIHSVEEVVSLPWHYVGSSGTIHLDYNFKVGKSYIIYMNWSNATGQLSYTLSGTCTYEEIYHPNNNNMIINAITSGHLSFTFSGMESTGYMSINVVEV